ncbi:hypothetical protein HYW76_02605 [Candidatus Pacearchaeota archaeon]|nr:hypothetical protein [Candidatus Pacearchaeota archaeon]
MQESILNALFERIEGLGIVSGEFIASIIIAILVIIIGVFIGKILKFLFRKLFEKTKLEKVINLSFINLFLSVLKWSIYILFINLALLELNVPALTGWLVTILGVIPAITGALILISVGFAIATYLKDVVAESHLEGCMLLSKIFFFFILYIFVIFAFKTALISIQDRLLSNILIVGFTLLGGAALLINYYKER